MYSDCYSKHLTFDVYIPCSSFNSSFYSKLFSHCKVWYFSNFKFSDFPKFALCKVRYFSNYHFSDLMLLTCVSCVRLLSPLIAYVHRSFCSALKSLILALEFSTFTLLVSCRQAQIRGCDRSRSTILYSVVIFTLMHIYHCIREYFVTLFSKTTVM